MSRRRLIPFEALKDKGIPFSKVHVWRLEKAGLFPRRVRIGISSHRDDDDSDNCGRSNYAYVEDEIDRYVQMLIKIRDGDPSLRNELIRDFVEQLINEGDNRKDAA
jgi:prophage regulatory protein